MSEAPARYKRDPHSGALVLLPNPELRARDERIARLERDLAELREEQRAQAGEIERLRRFPVI